jgi:hypothetical protein
MTLILSYISQDHIIQVSDRRFTSADSTSSKQDNKAVAFAGQLSFAYTGLGSLFSDISMTMLNTDGWLVKTLVHACEKYPRQNDNLAWLSSILAVVADKAELALDKYRLRFPGQIDRHAFIGVGWDALENSSSELRPLMVKISNFHDNAGNELATSNSKFNIIWRYLGDDESFYLDFTGISVSEENKKRIRSMLKTMHKRKKDALKIAELLVNVIYTVAEKTPLVSKDLMILHYPKKGVLRQSSGELLPGSHSAPITDLFPIDAISGVGWYRPGTGGWFFANSVPATEAVSFFHLPEDSSELIRYSPIIVDPSGFTTHTIIEYFPVDTSTAPIDTRPIYDSCQATILSDWRERYDPIFGDLVRYYSFEEHYTQHEYTNISVAPSWNVDEECPYYGVVLCVKVSDTDLEKLHLDTHFFVITSRENDPLQVPDAIWIQQLQSWLEHRDMPEEELKLFLEVIRHNPRKDILDRLRLLMVTRREVFSAQCREFRGD